jgi:hypothetical protein
MVQKKQFYYFWCIKFIIRVGINEVEY